MARINSSNLPTLENRTKKPLLIPLFLLVTSLASSFTAGVSPSFVSSRFLNSTHLSLHFGQRWFTSRRRALCKAASVGRGGDVQRKAEAPQALPPRPHHPGSQISWELGSDGHQARESSDDKQVGALVRRQAVWLTPPILQSAELRDSLCPQSEAKCSSAFTQSSCQAPGSLSGYKAEQGRDRPTGQRTAHVPPSDYRLAGSREAAAALLLLLRRRMSAVAQGPSEPQPAIPFWCPAISSVVPAESLNGSSPDIIKC